jgi:tripartite-type tricarboxylate transporter receptor subunit TctC
MKKMNHSPARRRVLQAIGAAAAVPLITPSRAQAQNTPDTIRLVVGFPAGNPVEAPGRALAQALHLTTGRTYVIDNKPGAGGLLAANEVARSRPDGSSMLWVNASHTVSPVIYRKLPFDAINDFTPLSQILTTSGFALLVGRNSPYRTVQDLIKAGQAQPGKVSFASYGVGNAIHLIGELFGNAVKTKFLHVPYRTSPIPDLIGGHVDFTWLGIDISKRMVDAGDARVLAVTSRSRIPEAPNAPTYAELGLHGIDVPAWGGVVGPRGMSPELVQRTQAEMATAVKHKVFLDYVKSSGDMQVIANSPAEFGTYLKTEVDRLRKLLAPLGLALDSGFS